MATPEALSLAPGPPESESPCAQKSTYFERSRPGRVATTVCAASVPVLASSVKATRGFSPAATRARNGFASRGEMAKTGTLQVPRSRPTPGHPDADARPSNSTAAQPAVVSGVGLADTRHTAPGAASTDSVPSPLAEGEPELGQVVFSTSVPASDALVVVRTSQATG